MWAKWLEAKWVCHILLCGKRLDLSAFLGTRSKVFEEPVLLDWLAFLLKSLVKNGLFNLNMGAVVFDFFIVFECFTSSPCSLFIEGVSWSFSFSFDFELDKEAMVFKYGFFVLKLSVLIAGLGANAALVWYLLGKMELAWKEADLLLLKAMALVVMGDVDKGDVCAEDDEGDDVE